MRLYTVLTSLQCVGQMDRNEATMATAQYNTTARLVGHTLDKSLYYNTPWYIQ